MFAIDNWVIFWKIMLVIAGSLFFGIGAITALKGAQDILRMFAGLRRTDVDHDR